jgi:CheY-like chemotaxis protein/two-component sensor histidine kinase
MAERQAGHVARLIDAPTDVYRISRGKIEIRKETVDLSATLARAAEAARPLLAERKHELVAEMPARSIFPEADSTRLEQVLANLLNKASKYTDPAGRVSLSTAALEGNEVVIRVRDTGIGIEPATLGLVYDLFVQAERRLDRSRGGLGLGLSLVKNLVELHGGSVQARSDGLGKGSEFTLRLPALQEQVGTAERPTRPVGRPPGRRVLVVDDNGDAADSLGRLLARPWRHEARVACDGPSALSLARSFHPQIVLLDIGLPGMDGCEVARRLRANPEAAEALLVAVTGWGQGRDRLQVRQAGFDHHLVSRSTPTTSKGSWRPTPNPWP